MAKRTPLLTLLFALCLALAACTSGGGTDASDDSGATGTTEEAAAPASAAAGGGEYERTETLYTSGTQWGPPSNWNPLMDWAYATGTVGLVYETLFTYDPLADEYTPWLAESGDWTSDNVYELTVRDGVTWSDGEPFTAEDVVFTFQLGEQFDSVTFAPLWDWLDSAEATDERTVVFTFNQPLYQEWANYLYNIPMVPQHLWGEFGEEEVASGANEEPIGTGPYLYSTHAEDRMVWERNDEWWGIEALDMEMQPRWIVDIVNSNNSNALGLVVQGQLDLSNNFLPGVASLVGGVGGYGLRTYFPEAPYMLPANTAWLVTNNTKAPMDDAEFRRALAHSIDVNQIVERVYDNIVSPASPTGLLPIWDEYIDQQVVDELGFTYDANQAREILSQAGYTDTNGDGFVETPEGEEIALRVQVPNGWTDWMEAVRVIADGAQAVGINLEPDFPDYNAMVDGRNSGNFDMVIANDEQMSNTPWTYLDWVFQEPIQETMTNGNYGRYENQEAFDLVVQLDQTPIDDRAGMQEIISQIQQIQLQELPVIPLWYNGLWSQYSESTWTNWPSAEEGNQFLPTTWRGYLQMSGIQTLAALEPAPPAEEPQG